MKQLTMRHAMQPDKYSGTSTFERSLTFSKALLVATTFLLILVLSSCNKDDHHKGNDGCMYAFAKMHPQTVKELEAARNATAKYRNINNAINDGYSDINVVTEHMGFHYMKASLADDKFEAEKPEILVYNRKENGQIELVAVEYAVPIPVRPNAAPEGFTGDSDVWTYSTEFNLWLLHAWVWECNPDGVFNPTNPLVHLH